jgi:hypothetical protein
MSEAHRPVRLRVRQRNARREQQRVDAAPVLGIEIADREAGLPRGVPPRLAVVPADDLGAALVERARGRDAGAAEPEHGDALVLECRGANHVSYLSLGLD